MAKFRSAALVIFNPPTHAQEHRGEGRDTARGPAGHATGQAKIRVLEAGGEPALI